MAKLPALQAKLASTQVLVDSSICQLKNSSSRVEGELTYTQTFDAENRLATVTVKSQTTTFIYNGDGILVKKINGDGTSAIYIINCGEANAPSAPTSKLPAFF